MDRFLARQPILDRRRQLHGYELLYRAGPENRYDATDADFATKSVMDHALYVSDLKRLTSGRLAFINVTEGILLEDLRGILPHDLTVLELLETVPPSPVVVDACRKQKRQGYRLALDDFVYERRMEPLIELADIVKVDWRASTIDERQVLIATLKKRRVEVLAEKVETWEEFTEALECGCAYFQGHFFSKPEMVRNRSLPSRRTSHLRLLAELNAEELDFAAIEDVIKREVSLSHKLLRRINSASFGFKGQIKSIHNALVLMGEREFRRWASVAVIGELASGKPEHLLVHASVRGRTCEILAPAAGFRGREQELFLFGMFSMLDALLDQRINELVASLSLAQDVHQALLGGGGTMRALLDVVRAHEDAQWRASADAAATLGLPEGAVPAAYAAALDWAEESRERFAEAA